MRTFTCFLFSKQSSVPDLFLIHAASEQRARALARREYLAEKAVAVELCEGNEVLWREAADPDSGVAWRMVDAAGIEPATPTMST